MQSSLVGGNLNRIMFEPAANNRRIDIDSADKYTDCEVVPWTSMRPTTRWFSASDQRTHRLERSRFVVPAPVVDQVTALGLGADRVLGAEVDVPLSIGAAHVTPIPARHGVEMADAYTFGQELSGGKYRYLGYVVELNGVRVYHGG